MANSRNVEAYAKRFPHGCWSFLGLGCEKTWYGTHVSKPNGVWNSTGEAMMLNFAESGHPVLRATSASERGEVLKVKDVERSPLISTAVMTRLN